MFFLTLIKKTLKTFDICGLEVGWAQGVWGQQGHRPGAELRLRWRSGSQKYP